MTVWVNIEARKTRLSAGFEGGNGKMATGEFLIILLSGVVMGLLLSMLIRWVGRKLLSGNRQKEGGDINRAKELKKTL